MTSVYCQFRLYQHHVISLLLNFTMRQLKIVLSFYNVLYATTQYTIVHHILHHAATQNPGHSTKFVTLPSPVLLY